MRLSFSLLTLAVGAVMAVPSFAQPVLGIDGVAQVGSTYINFGQFPAGAPYNPAPGTGSFEVTQPILNLFASSGVTAGEMGNITSLSAAMETPGVPLSTSIKFMTFSGGGSNLVLYLTELLPGNLPASPFTLSQYTDPITGQTDTVASFRMNGYIDDTATKATESYTGTFSATFDDETIAELTSNLPQVSPFSATFSLSTATPEPASLVLAGVGLLGAGLVARRRKINS